MNVKPRQNQWSVFSAARPGVAGVVETPIALTLAFSDSSIAFCLVELYPTTTNPTTVEVSVATVN